MADRTLYDILEVSNSASQDAIRAAYERLSQKSDPAHESNAGNADARFQHNAIKEALFTLSNAETRAQYDRKLEQRAAGAIRNVEILEPFWTLPKLIVAGLVVLVLGGFYFKYQQTQARLEAEKVIAAAKAKEGEDKAKAEAEADRIALERVREQKMEERQRYREQQSDVRQFRGDSTRDAIVNRGISSFDRAQDRSTANAERAEEARRKREEAQAAAAARQSLARDKAELCRIERERYGRSISC